MNPFNLHRAVAGCVRPAWLAGCFALSVHGSSGASACTVTPIEIPVQIVAGRPIAQVQLNGRALPMLVDSGAFYSMLPRSTATELGLTLTSLPFGAVILGYTGVIEAEVTKVSRVGFSGVELPDREFLVGGNELGSGIRGILGRNILSLADTEYDLAHGMVRIMIAKGDCKSKNFAYWAQPDAAVSEVALSPGGQGDTAIRVRAKVNDRSVRAFLDTGARISSLVRPVALRAGIAESDLVPMGTIGGAGHGRARSWSAPVKSFELGGLRALNNRVMVTDTESDDHDVLLGLDFFLSHRIYVSRLQGKVYATWNGGPIFALNRSDDDPAPAGAVVATEQVADDDVAGLARRGQAAAARGDWSRALQDLDRACALAPTSAPLAVARARVHLARGQPDEGVKELSRALQLDQALHDARLLRAETEALRGSSTTVLDDLRYLDAALTPVADERRRMGTTYAVLGLAPEALLQWSQWLGPRGHDAGRADVLDSRCRMRARLRLDLPLALADCEQALRLDPDNASFHDSLGWLHLHRGDATSAWKSFDRAIRLQPALAFSFYGRAQAHRHLQQLQRADEDLAAARRLRPEIDAEVDAAGFEVGQESRATVLN